jgi:hypothetical protein
MREPSLRPERSASANSATSAFFMRTEFYLKGAFCQPDVFEEVEKDAPEDDDHSISRLEAKSNFQDGTKFLLIRHVYAFQD